MTSRAPLHFGVLIGSARPNNNNHGIFQWVRQHLERIAPGSKISVYEPFTAPLPLGPFTGSYMAMTLDAVRDSDGHALFPYSTEKDKEWSKIVQDFDAVIVCTPQYNWGIPSTIKESIDHLFNEWVKMPFLAVNYGGQGGNKCAYALRQVIDGMMADPVSVEKIMIKLPPTYTGGPERVTPSTEFLKEYEVLLGEELEKLVSAAQVRQEEKRGFVFQAKAYVAAAKAKQRAAAAAAAGKAI